MADFTDTIFLDGDDMFIPLPLPDDITAFRDIVSPSVTLEMTLTPNPVEKDGPIVFDVVDVSNALRETIILATWPGKNDWVWKGTDPSGDYSTSSRSAITNGYRYTLRRVLGWPVPLPTGVFLRIHVFAVDVAGNVAP